MKVGREDDDEGIVFSLNKTNYIVPPRFASGFLYVFRPDVPSALGGVSALAYDCVQTDICDFATQPCFSEVGQCESWGNYQGAMAGGGGGGGDGGGGGSSSGSEAPKCPCPAPAYNYFGCCCSSCMFPDTPYLGSGAYLWEYKCICKPGCVFDGYGGCWSPWGPGGGDGQGGT